MLRLTLLLAVLAACGSSKELDQKKVGGLFTEVVVDTEPGLSGLAADAQGGLWTVAERARRAYHITLDAKNTPSVALFTITGVPDSIDLEGIEVLGDSKYAFGTEGREANMATILFGLATTTNIAIESTLTLTAEQVGMQMKPNHGAEGICGHGSTVIVAIEGATEEGDKRWAPVLRVENGAFVRAHRVYLTSPTGKLSGLDCEIAADGTAEVWAIERHFNVTRILHFTIPDRDDQQYITPRVALDIGKVIDSKRNLEGIAQLPDGRIVTVSDNQWKSIDGPSTLQVFGAGVVK